MVLFRYFEKERLLRFKETMCLMAASLGSEQAIRDAIRKYQHELFPEVGIEEKNFEKAGIESIEAMQNKAFVLSQMGEEYTELFTMESEAKDVTDVEGIRKDQQKIAEIASKYHFDEMDKVLTQYKGKFGRYPRGYEHWDQIRENRLAKD